MSSGDPETSLRRGVPTTSGAPRQTAGSTPGHPAANVGSPTPSERDAIVAAWTASEEAFYRAGQLGDASYPPLAASFAPGSPAEPRTVAWLEALESAGIVAPSAHRIGGARVQSVRGATAYLTGCTYDSGAVYRSSGDPAPSDLGGGAGYTASRAVLRLVAGHWLVWSDRTTTVSSSKERGPCHGF